MGGMKTSTYKLTAVEQEVLDGVTVRLINASEQERFDALIIKGLQTFEWAPPTGCGNSGG